ncbi:hypothetical protein BHS09_17750 [Myxococcus xanthus]|uniref:Uncharacterized protein n=1 Tax=Myxococcus xanthus TaxID=34 RepID=A0AAE6G0J5_MYXXA|nr:hypothetical protein BHS09_17750 [Myxococcus xanthus]QDE75950.1 hypothetical protein BHS08_17765 [Myxococcus xanthus]
MTQAPELTIQTALGMSPETFWTMPFEKLLPPTEPLNEGRNSVTLVHRLGNAVDNILGKDSEDITIWWGREPETKPD